MLLAYPFSPVISLYTFVQKYSRRLVAIGNRGKVLQHGESEASPASPAREAVKTLRTLPALQQQIGVTASAVIQLIKFQLELSGFSAYAKIITRFHNVNLHVESETMRT